MRNKLLLLVFAVMFMAQQPLSAQSVPDYTVQLSAETQKSPARITLKWKPNTGTVAYRVFRRAKTSNNWGAALATLPGTATSWADNNVVAGIGYDYYVQRTGATYKGHGYVFSGIDVPARERQGTILLVIDDTFSTPLAAELQRFEHDLRMEGWMVKKREVSRNATVASVKNMIVAEYNADRTNLRTVFLIGHIPVPYSGYFAIDGHTDHGGAWPADVYYGDMNGTWNDNDPRSDTSAARKKNWNIPGDGKFDEDLIPAGVELEVGRVDMYDLPLFNMTEVALMKRYFDKDHAFRTKVFTAKHRAVIDDNFGPMGGEALAYSAYGNFSPMFGDTNVNPGDFRNDPAQDSYMWSYGSGAGTYTSGTGLTTTAAFTNDSLQSVFSLMMGSYFGDWDSQNNLMRAALASRGFTLTNGWSGRPHWILHHMALGENIGYAVRRSQSDTSFFRSFYGNEFGLFRQTALLGDPTLNMYVTAAPRSLTLSHNNNDSSKVNLQWQQPLNEQVQAYYVYRANTMNSQFTRIDSVAGNITAYLDSAPQSGNNVYMVRALKLNTSPSGTFYNLSPGITDSIQSSGTTGINAVAEINYLLNLYPNPTEGFAFLEFSGVRNDAQGVISVSDILGKLIHTQNFATSQESIIKLDLSTQPKGVYIINVASKNANHTYKLIKSK